MRRFLLDTNICLAYIRANALYQQVEKQLNLSDADTVILISVVTKAELLSLGQKNNWGNSKLLKLSQLLRKLVILDINESDEDLMNAYAQIDAFSQGKLTTKKLATSARNMGKNDLWIASAAYVSSADIVTTDGDFDHLNKVWITVHKFEI